MKINYDTMKTFLPKAFKFIGSALAVLSIIYSFVCSTLYMHDKHRNTRFHVYEEMNVLSYEHTKYELVMAVDKYIKDTAPTSCLNGITLVDKCLEYDIDICFTLAQGQVESHFGTKGMARKTNSVWNVGAYDGYAYDSIPPLGKYASPDASIEPYLVLIKEQYIGDSRTEYDLLNKYVSLKGKRFASAENYENTVRKQFTFIKNNTPIDSLSLEMKKFGIILGY